MTEDLLLGVALFISLLSMIVFYSVKDDGEAYGRVVKIPVYAAGTIILLVSIMLMQAIFANNFELAYVQSYSSIELPVIYKISAFWAGQQGSFLLWALIHAAAGVALCYKKSLSPKGMAAYMLVQSALIIFVLGKSPFAPAEVVSSDGIGMNPLLQDPWMAVHPPIVFIGYALLAIPFCATVGALLDNLPNKAWLEMARKWTLAAWSFLGAGIFIGGYWAYKVLGWGGYWGWDPVENSSLVPWLLAAIYIHVLKVTKVRAGAISTLHLAAIFTYAAVIYGTFLTRSGILGDFSVHSFSGTSIGLTIAVANGLLLIAGLFLLAKKSSKLSQEKLYDVFGTREFLILLGALALLFVVMVVFMGMSMPLLTMLVGKSAAVDTNFYVKLCMPLAVMLLLTMILASWYGYGKESRKIITDGKPAVIGMTVFCGAFTFFTGVHELLAIALAALAGGALAATVQTYRKGLISTGGMIAHAGVALSLLAMMLAGNGSQTISKEIAANETVEVMNHSITYKGQEIFVDNDYKEYIYEVDGSEVRALTKLRKSGEDAAREPAIYRGVAGDVYIAPTPAKAEGVFELTIKHGGMDMDDLLAYRYDDVKMEPDTENPDITVVTAKIAVTDGDKVEEVFPTIMATETGATSKPISVMGDTKQIRLTGVSGDNKTIRLETMPSLSDVSNTAITASISTKPYIWLLWLSAVLVTVGCFVAIKK